MTLPRGTAGSIRIWKKDGTASRCATDYIVPDVSYSLNSLGFTSTTDVLTFYVEGLVENRSIATYNDVDFAKQNSTIMLELVETDALTTLRTTVGRDVVRYVVASRNTFYYQLATNQLFRCFVASDFVYEGKKDEQEEEKNGYRWAEDLQNFGLTTDGANQSLSAYVKEQVYDPSDNPTATDDGFFARVYYDYNSRKNIVAFRGTDDIDDWINNAQQALSSYGIKSTQYEKAMSIGCWIYDCVENDVLNDLAIDDIIFTGHSLGGGLAATCAFMATPDDSAAWRTVTFNAAHVRDDSFNFKPKRSAYTDYIKNYNQSQNLIQAYVVRGELLDEWQSTVSARANGAFYLLDVSEEHSSRDRHKTDVVIEGLMNLSQRPGMYNGE